MKLRHLTVLSSLILGALSPLAAQADMPQEVKNIVLVHGLFADGSSW